MPLVIDLPRSPPVARDEDSKVGRTINRAINAALVHERDAEESRGYLGASVLGSPCDRKLLFEYLGHPSEPFEGRKLRIFDIGRTFEELLIRWLRIAGFDLVDTDPNTGRQWEFETANGKIRGHADGVILSGPDIGAAYPLLWEAKTLNDASWSNLAKRRLRQSEEVYFGQVMIYLHFFGFQQCLFTALNKNNGELYHEVITLDPEEAQRLVDRAVRIVGVAEAGGLLPRTADTYVCQGCRFSKPCWNPS